MRSRLLTLILLVTGASSCTSAQVSMGLLVEPDLCRETVGGNGGDTAPLLWIGPTAPKHRQVLDRWCEAVGPALAREGPGAPGDPTTDELVVVSWNVHVGGGDIVGLVDALRAGRFSDGRPVQHFVVLLQEAFRDGDAVPTEMTRQARVPGEIVPRTGTRPRRAIADVASRLGLTLLYVPSMRNGPASATREDRGSAILATCPLREPVAIELPFERHRRVAVAARVQGRDASGSPWSLLVSSVHLDHLAGARYVWVVTGPPRKRQALALVAALPREDAAVVAGDLNSWSGFDDAAYRELATHFPDAPATDRRATFKGLLRLDHMLFRLPPGWDANATRLDDRFGSDHYPVLGRIRIKGAA